MFFGNIFRENVYFFRLTAIIKIFNIMVVLYVTKHALVI